MGNEVKTDMSQRTLASANAMANEASEEVQKKEKLYEEAKGQFSIFMDIKWRFESQMKSSKYKDDSSFKAQYNALLASVSDSEINVDVSRGSLQNSLSWSSKANTSAYVTNSVLNNLC